MRVCIHRGTQEVGGNCIEIESAGKRIVLDVGLPLDAEDSPVSLPDVKGFHEHDPSLLGVVISHPHQDHYGLKEKERGHSRFLRRVATSLRLLKASTTASGSIRAWIKRTGTFWVSATNNGDILN